jgi:hypothetical protein
MSERLAQDVLFHGRVVTLEILGPETIGVRRGELTPDLLEHLKAHKAEIIAAACAREFATWQSERPSPGEDPRPDLAEDSARWTALLSAAYELDGEDPTGTWAALHVVRCLGAAIAIQRGKWRIEPGDYEPGEWAADRARYLAPRTATIKRLLAAMAEGPATTGPRTAAAIEQNLIKPDILGDLEHVAAR